MEMLRTEADLNGHFHNVDMTITFRGPRALLDEINSAADSWIRDIKRD